MRLLTAVVLFCLVAGSAFAQEQTGLVVQNPLDEIREALTETLAEAEMPFSDEQVRAIALAMDEQRRATEDLFGEVFDFSGGPPQGDQLDEALAGIAYMSEAFLADVDEVLTAEQGEVWLRARVEGTVPERARIGEGAASGGAGSSSQIAQIRINNNPFTAETLGGGNFNGFGGGWFRGGGRGGGRGGAAVAAVVVVATTRSSRAVAWARFTAT